MQDKSFRRGSPRRRLVALGLAVVILLASRFLPDGFLDPFLDRAQGRGSTTESSATPSITDSSRTDSQTSRGDYRTGRQRIARAFEQRESGIWVEADARVKRTLRDDNQGSRHQKFLVELEDQTLLISHNIDLAPRVPLEAGDRVVFRGRYEWNDRGGVVHWTHHDPQGRRPGGWISHGNKTYK